MCDFEEKDEITVLKCNPAHFYHSECIIRWIAEQKNSCPHCRAPIENIENLRSALEGGEYDGLLRNIKKRA